MQSDIWEKKNNNHDFVEERDKLAKLIQLRNVLERYKFDGLSRKVQLKPLKWEKNDATKKEIVTQALFILKWGGELTHSGVSQA